MPRKSRGGNLSRKSMQSKYERRKRAMATEEEREARLLAERLRSKERRARKREADKVDNNLSCPSSDIPQTSGSSPQNAFALQSNSNESDPSLQPVPSQPQPVAHRVPSTHKIAQNFDHNNPPPPFSLGQLTELCPFCNALSFPEETINCCHKGKVQIDLPPMSRETRKPFYW